MSWNNVIANTYDVLVNSRRLFGARKSKPLFVKSSESVSVNDASLINIDSIALTAGVEKVLLTIRNRATFDGITNAISIKLATLTFQTDGTKAVSFKIYKNSTTAGTFNYWNEAASRIEVSTNTTLATTTETVGTITKIINEIGSTILAKEDVQRFNLLEGDVIIDLKPNETITFTAKSVNTSNVSLITRIKEK